MKSVRVSADCPHAPQVYRRLPDGEVELLVRFGDFTTTACVVGARTQALTKYAPRRASTCAIRFRVAGAYPFFRRPLMDLTDAVVPLAELWDRELCSRLEAARGAAPVAQAALSSLERVLDAGVSADLDWGPRVGRLLSSFGSRAPLPRVTELAHQVGLSERHLRRVFLDAVGLSPKRCLAILRFQRALAMAREKRHPNWASIAQRAGYFDQAHLIREFRALSGLTPCQHSGWPSPGVAG